MDQLFALVPDALNDARAIFARRWWLLLASVVLAAVYELGKGPARAHDLTASYALGGLGFFVAAITLTGYVFADTMRIDQPDYALDAGRIFLLFLIGIGVALITFAVSIPGLIFMSYGILIARIWALVAEAFVSTKLGYVFFAAENEEGAFRYSWRITSGAAFWPTLALAAIYVIGVGILQMLVGFAVGYLPTFGPAPVAAIACLINFGAAMFFSPWMIRWMRVAETMQTVVPA